MSEIKPSERPGPDRLRPSQGGEVHAFETLTAAALDALIERGTTTAVVPFGSIEHQGPHLPVGADALLADVVGREVAVRLGALLLPTFRVGEASAHAGRPGTITLDATTLTDTAVSVGRGLADHGVRVIAFVSTHGGNSRPLDAAVSQMNDAPVGAAPCAPRGDTGPAPGAHSGAWLTSVLLALAPELVDLEAASSDLADELAGASAERGAEHLERFVSSVVRQVREVIAAL